MTGRYFANGKLKRASPRSYDEVVAGRAVASERQPGRTHLLASGLRPLGFIDSDEDGAVDLGGTVKWSALPTKTYATSRHELGGMVQVSAGDHADHRISPRHWMIGQEQYREAVGRDLDGAADGAFAR